MCFSESAQISPTGTVSFIVCVSILSTLNLQTLEVFFFFFKSLNMQNRSFIIKYFVACL